MAPRGRKNGGGGGSGTKKADAPPPVAATTTPAKGAAGRPDPKHKPPHPKPAVTPTTTEKPPAATVPAPASVGGVAQLNLETAPAAASAAANASNGSVRHEGRGNGRAAVEMKRDVPPPPAKAKVAEAKDAKPSGASPPKVREGGSNAIDVKTPTTLASTGAAPAVVPVAESLMPSTAPAVFESKDDATDLSTLGTMPALQTPTIVRPVRVEERREPPTAETPTPAEPQAARPVTQPALLFEIGWEVCWQLGGIYTVLRSKAATMLKTWGDRYCLVGPYNPVTAPVEFEPEEPEGYMAECVRRMREMGIPCHFGRWMIAGRPHVLLIDYRAKFRDLDGDKYLMWADHGISVPNNDGELNEVVAFGFACTEFFKILSSAVTDRPLLAHFHEWMAGVPVPRIAHLRLPIATVFTTHATLLGRYLAGDSPEFYNHLPFLNADFEAKKYMIYPRYQIEKAATHASVVFTTVSEVTAYEAEKLLGRRADAILPNGLNIQRFAALHEFQNLHRQYKEQIHQFVMGHFFPSYTFDLDRTIYLVTSGRYEYGNKGMDVFIEALYRLNQRMRYVPDHPTVVAFIITKAPIRHVNIQALQSQTMFQELKRTCTEIQEEMGERLLAAAAKGEIANTCDLMGGDAQVRLKRAMHAWRTGQNPTIVTHDLVDDAGDPVLKHLRYRQLFNLKDDPVKVVFHPQFVTQTGPLINLDYEQFVRGCHAGIFPSYYEPWGYTPMECVALGVPAVTTDLSGFGAYVRRHIPDSGDKGICVLNRRYRNFDECCNELVDYLFDFVRQSRRQRIELRNKVERLSELFDWSALGRHYREAHDMAFERIGAPRPGRVEIRMV